MPGLLREWPQRFHAGAGEVNIQIKGFGDYALVGSLYQSLAIYQALRIVFNLWFHSLVVALKFVNLFAPQFVHSVVLPALK